METFQQKINKYKIPYIDYKNIGWKQRIGSGVNGDVYNGILQDNTPVILKIYCLDDYYNENHFYEDATDELYNYSLLKGLFHCCELYGYSYSIENDTKEIYLVMKDYGVVGNIYDYLSEFKYWTTFEKREINENEYSHVYDGVYNHYHLNRDTKIKITYAICDAIKELHEHNIVHCDLKLQNMLYDSKENLVTLIDFGVSCNLKNETSLSIDENMGTDGYMSYELYNGCVSKRSDIYSLGVLLLELWVGDIWKDGETFEDCYDEILQSLKILKENEPELVKVLRPCLSSKVEKRPYINTLVRRLQKIS
jgi:serine/threonine protein kinase